MSEAVSIAPLKIIGTGLLAAGTFGALASLTLSTGLSFGLLGLLAGIVLITIVLTVYGVVAVVQGLYPSFVPFTIAWIFMITALAHDDIKLDLIVSGTVLAIAGAVLLFVSPLFSRSTTTN